MAPSGVAQENLGTPTGVPSYSPGVMWPRSFSLESLGTGRLYPNGPEFGLSNTSGGFGSTGTGRVTGVGLSERSVSGMVQEEMERPYILFRHVTDSFNSERFASSTVFSAALGNQFRSRLQSGSLSADSGYAQPAIQTDRPSGVDSVLQDKPATPDAVLKTGL